MTLSGGGTQFFFFFFFFLMPHVFLKVESTKWIFLKKTREQIFAKISVFGAEILPKSERNWPKNAEFFGKW